VSEPMNEVNLHVVVRRQEHLGELVQALAGGGGQMIGMAWEDQEDGPLVVHVAMPESGWGAVASAAEDRFDALPFDWRDSATLRRPDA
jgi:hypothetical protein